MTLPSTILIPLACSFCQLMTTASSASRKMNSRPLYLIPSMTLGSRLSKSKLAVLTPIDKDSCKKQSGGNLGDYEALYQQGPVPVPSNIIGPSSAQVTGSRFVATRVMV